MRRNWYRRLYDQSLNNRLKHYFLTYKDLPGNKRDTEITHTYDAEEARDIIRRSMEDYQNKFDKLDNILENV